MIQKTRFMPPASGRGAREREIPIGVAGGLHAGVPSQSVQVGFSPALQNFVPVGGAITPRSAISSYNSAMGGPVLGAFESFDDNGSALGVAISATSVNVFYRSNQAWSRMSYVAGSNSAWSNFWGDISANSLGYFRGVTVYDPGFNDTIFVFSNYSNSLKYFRTPSGTVTYSDFTWPASIDTTVGAFDVTAINNRLVLFNTLRRNHASDSTVPYVTRVMWSARGNPRSFLVADGAGAEDLMEMKGAGQAAIAWQDILLLFTSQEIWRGTPTLDDYAFRFDLGVGDMGTPFPRTIATTPLGVVFLGQDFEVYLTDGASVTALGPTQGSPSRIQTKLKNEIVLAYRAWGEYNVATNRYALYYSVAGSPGGFPSRALEYDFATQTWWPQSFSHGFSAGAERLDYSGQEALQLFNHSSDTKRAMDVYDSAGSAFVMSSAKTNDFGSAIDARWRSPGLKNAMRKGHLKEIWIDTEADSASSASVFLGSARSGSVFTAEREVALTTANDPIFVPCWTTDNAPAFEVRIADGGRPRIAAFSATVEDASKF